jgi:hypothetical protein
MWKARLRKSIRLADGRIIKTLADARDAILELPDKDLRRPQWQGLVGLLLSAAYSENQDLLAIASTRLEVMLPRLAHTDQSALPPKKPPAPSAKHLLKRGRKAKLLK